MSKTDVGCRARGLILFFIFPPNSSILRKHNQLDVSQKMHSSDIEMSAHMQKSRNIDRGHTYRWLINSK